MEIYFFKSKILLNKIFPIILLLFLQFINIKGYNYSEIIDKNYYLINDLTNGNNLRFCKECICVSYQIPKYDESFAVCLVKKNLYILKQNGGILTYFNLTANLTEPEIYYNLIPFKMLDEASFSYNEQT